MGIRVMWVLLLLGLLPLAVLPTMLGGPDGSGADSGDDDADSDAGSAEVGPGEDGFDWITDAEDDAAVPVPDRGGGTDPEAGEETDVASDDVPADPSDNGPPAFVATTFALGIGDGVATFADFVPGEDRLEIHVDPEGPTPEVTSGAIDGGAWVQVRQGETSAAALFPGLSAPPLGDVVLVSGVLEPDLSDDGPPEDPPADDPDQAGPLMPVTDDQDAPGGEDAEADEVVLMPVVPAEDGR
jgi:hypothetical protein